MKSWSASVEGSLNRVELGWKALCFLRSSSMLGIAACVGILTWVGALTVGLVTNRTVALALLGFILSSILIALGLLIIRLAGWNADRRQMAAALERHDRRLLDRLNTLLFLKSKPAESPAGAFAGRIARQAEPLLAQRPARLPFDPRPSLVWFAGFAALLIATILVGRHLAPWRHLQAAHQRPPSRLAPTGVAEITKPIVAAETNRFWGEVRITDPGADLTVTKVDVVPLQIEAAANRPLTNIAWFSTVNGSNEAPHALPAPTEPCYGTYHPSIYVDELHLSDWDVVSYYARASTDRSNSYASQVFFLEVRPFREDILKLPGGAGGQAYQTLSEISSLISRQQRVIRQTHQHAQKPPESETVRNQDREKLAAAEGDLSDSAQHLYADLAAAMENKPIGDALDNLDQAEHSLDQASSLLHGNALAQGQNLERRALSELVAARKIFQKAVSDNPAAFDGPSNGQDPQPVADSSQKLSQMAEFRNEAKAARDFAWKTLEAQKQVEQQASGKTDPSLAQKERQLQKSLENFQAQHPNAFKGAEAQSQAAQQALAKAGNELQDGAGAGRDAAQQATRSLQEFNDHLQKQAATRQLADAYKLKQMLDRQKQLLDQRAQAKNGVSDEDARNAARAAREAVDQLKKTAEQEPTRDAFGQPLRDALAGQNKVDLDAQLLQLEQEQDPAATQGRAATARDALGKVSKAFDQSQPKSLQMARNDDALKPRDEDRLNQGAAELDSLIQSLEKDSQQSSADQAKQGEQAMNDLQTGMRSRFGDSADGNQLLGQLKDALQQEHPVISDLKRLLEQIQQFALESSEQLAKKEDQPEVTNIDPSRLPPAYRGPIQRYFEKLSQP